MRKSDVFRKGHNLAKAQKNEKSAEKYKNKTRFYTGQKKKKAVK
ncbi:hypothetical protein ACVRWQ_04665 [Streptococcus phocae subsp. salmonis]